MSRELKTAVLIFGASFAMRILVCPALIWGLCQATGHSQESGVAAVVAVIFGASFIHRDAILIGSRLWL